MGRFIENGWNDSFNFDLRKYVKKVKWRKNYPIRWCKNYPIRCERCCQQLLMLIATFKVQTLWKTSLHWQTCIFKSFYINLLEFCFIIVIFFLIFASSLVIFIIFSVKSQLTCYCSRWSKVVPTSWFTFNISAFSHQLLSFFNTQTLCICSKLNFLTTVSKLNLLNSPKTYLLEAKWKLTTPNQKKKPSASDKTFPQNLETS